MDAINAQLKEYIEKSIFPKYNKYYSHGMIHINSVINNMLMLANYYNLDQNMAYVIASYHDIGLNVNRENHEYESGKILESEIELKKYFTPEQIEVMKQAVEDHRGSRKIRPRNIYVECVSDSDRDFDIKIHIKRQISTSIKNYPQKKSFDEHFKNCYEYACERINDNGKFNLWTNNPILVERRDNFQKDFLNKEYAKLLYKEEWDRISADGTKEKIINFYEDY